MAYARPPIVEAVIELRFTQVVPEKTLERAAKRIKSDYFSEEIENLLQIEIDPATGATHRRVASRGRKLSSLDRTDQLLLRPNAFACSRLAPYTGWEAFFERAQTGWTEWKKVAGVIALSRIGVRYINRIDIPPGRPTEPVRIEDYLNVSPKMPTDIGTPLATYAMNVTWPWNENGYTVILNTSSVTSPLVGFVSFVLDLDFGKERDLPMSDDRIWAQVADMREIKNRAFEYCITDRARSLFSR
jgi:uncharacterized protein (TIGR04255 family)